MHLKGSDHVHEMQWCENITSDWQAMGINISCPIVPWYLVLLPLVMDSTRFWKQSVEIMVLT